MTKIFSWLKTFGSLSLAILKEGLEVARKGGQIALKIAKAYISMLYQLFIYSILHLLVCALLIVAGTMLEQSTLTIVGIFLGVPLVCIWLAASLPIGILYEYAPWEVQRAVRKMAKRMALAMVMALGIALIVKLGDLKNIEPDFPEPEQPPVQSETIEPTAQPEISIETEPDQTAFSPQDIPKQQAEPVTQEPAAVTPPAIQIEEPVPEPPPPAMTVLPQDLREFRRSYRDIFRNRKFGRYSRQDEQIALNTLEFELRKTLADWAKSKNIRIVESAHRLQAMEAELRTGRGRKSDPLDEAETASYMLSSNIGFQAVEQKDVSVDGRDIGRAVESIFRNNRKVRDISRAARDSKYESYTISIEVGLALYVYDANRILKSTADGRGKAENKIKLYSASGIGSVQETNRLILSAIQEAVKDAVSKIEL